MKQTGNTLLMILILMIIFTSISVSLYQMSVQEYQTSQQYQLRSHYFYETQQCLMQYINETNQLILHAIDMYLPQHNLSWWQKNGNGCNQHVWLYTELYTTDAQQNVEFIRISAYHDQHTLLQVMIKKNTLTQNVNVISWAQIY